MVFKFNSHKIKKSSMKSEIIEDFLMLGKDKIANLFYFYTSIIVNKHILMLVNYKLFFL